MRCMMGCGKWFADTTTEIEGPGHCCLPGGEAKLIVAAGSTGISGMDVFAGAGFRAEMKSVFVLVTHGGTGGGK